jgi:hypothetical protein
MAFEDETIKLYAAGYDEDEEADLDLDEEEDEEEEEELDDASEAPATSSNHAEEADLRAAPPNPVDTYDPASKLSSEPTRSQTVPDVGRSRALP